jgi:hypothetical protein
VVRAQGIGTLGILVETSRGKLFEGQWLPFTDSYGPALEIPPQILYPALN